MTAEEAQRTHEQDCLRHGLRALMNDRARKERMRRYMGES